MQPLIHLNWFAISVAVVANIIIGFLWYGPLLGKAWMHEMGLAPDHKPDPAVMKRSGEQNWSADLGAVYGFKDESGNLHQAPPLEDELSFKKG